MSRSPKNLADRRAPLVRRGGGFIRETYTLPREEARERARAFLNRWQPAAYMTEVESWRELLSGDIEFTMKRLRSAD